jgi:tetratricopeptide (TPR) repeat protein
MGSPPADPARGAATGSGRPQARVAPAGPTEAVVEGDHDHAAANPADRPSPGAAPAGDARPPSYEKLVVEGNRLRAHGSMARASKLYEQALAMRPDGVMALTGTGYVQLEHQRHFKAIDFFRRALAIDPTHGPALFGIAEAYRARGDMPEALAAYRQYLALAPSGDDVGEARRQIKALSSDDESP